MDRIVLVLASIPVLVIVIYILNRIENRKRAEGIRKGVEKKREEDPELDAYLKKRGL